MASTFLSPFNAARTSCVEGGLQRYQAPIHLPHTLVVIIQESPNLLELLQSVPSTLQVLLLCFSVVPPSLLFIAAICLFLVPVSCFTLVESSFVSRFQLHFVLFRLSLPSWSSHSLCFVFLSTAWRRWKMSTFFRIFYENLVEYKYKYESCLENLRICANCLQIAFD